MNAIFAYVVEPFADLQRRTKLLLSSAAVELNLDGRWSCVDGWLANT